jgi:hypothetical protein
MCNEWDEAMLLVHASRVYGKPPLEDALDDAVSLEELDATSPLNRAGIDDRTPVDTFMQANGNYIFLTGEQL